MFTTHALFFSSLKTFYLQTNPNNAHITLISCPSSIQPLKRPFTKVNTSKSHCKSSEYFGLSKKENIIKTWCDAHQDQLCSIIIWKSVFNIGTPLSFWKSPAQPSNEPSLAGGPTKPSCSWPKIVCKLKRTSAAKTQPILVFSTAWVKS